MSLRVWLPLIENTDNQGISSLNTFSYNTLIQQTDGKLGKCYSGQSIYHLENDFLSNEWSLCAWVKSAGWSQYNDIILCKNTSSADNCQFYFSIINGATLNFAVNTGSSGLTFNYTFATNTWYHVAATYNGSEYALYINGEQKKKQTISTTAKTGMNNLGINCRSTNTAGTSQTGDGGKKLNDVRIYDHALSAAEVHEISQGLVLHYKLNDITNGIEDSSGYNHNATLTNGSITNDTARFLHSLTLDASTKAIGETIFEAGVFIPEYTWAGWIKRNYTTTSSKQIHANIANVNLYSDFTPYLSWTSGKVDGSTTGNGAAGGTKIATLNEWVHMAITYKSGIGKFYIDGELIKTWDYTSQGVYIVTAANNTLGNSFIGNLSDVRIYTTALSADDILQLYHTSAKVDNKQKLHTFELVENQNKISINKQGQVLCKELTENTDTKFYKTNQAIDTAQIIEF